LPLDRASGRILPFPRTPVLRERSDRTLPAERLGKLKRRQVDLDPESVRRTPVPIAGMVFPRFNAGVSAKVEPCTASQAARELIRSCLNFRGRAETAARCICSLAERLPAFRLPFSQSERAVDKICEACNIRCRAASGER
jgi:hypothetical protein